MTKKTTVASETLVENLEEFTTELHQLSKGVMIESILEGDDEVFATANVIHDISHCLIDILKGKTAEEALERILDDDEEDEDVAFMGDVAINIKTGDIEGIENIKNPELKKQLVSALNKLTEKLEDE